MAIRASGVVAVHLQFLGGVTAARGHVGNNSGRAVVVSLVKTGSADRHEHEVYGCGLHDPNPRTDTPIRQDVST